MCLFFKVKKNDLFSDAHRGCKDAAVFRGGVCQGAGVGQLVCRIPAFRRLFCYRREGLPQGEARMAPDIPSLPLGCVAETKHQFAGSGYAECNGYKVQLQRTGTQSKNCFVPWLQVTVTIHRNTEYKLFHATVTSYSYNILEYGIKKQTVSRLIVCCLFI